MKNTKKNIFSYLKPSNFKSASTRVKILTVLTCFLLCAAVVAGTVAAYTSITSAFKNNFVLAKVENEIVEDFEDNEKKSVEIKNVGTISEFVRVAVVATWQDKDGNVYPKQPVEGTDYTVTYNTTDWQKDGDYWYHKDAVAVGDSTANLFKESLKLKQNGPDGYTLSVDILQEGIQENPSTAIESAWGLGASEGKIVFGED